MSSSDVRSILNLPTSVGAGSSSGTRRPAPATRKPDGITRELYALIGDNAPFLAETQASLASAKYKDRPKLKHQRSQWSSVPFTPALKKDTRLKLRHWVRVSDEEPNQRVDYFDSFNRHGPSIMEYSQFEYEQFLVDPDWTVEETGYLFDMIRLYDLRFIVIADRYAYSVAGQHGQERKRSVEDIKDRYYTICRRLIRTRTATDSTAQQQQVLAHSFDKNREIKRKQYASELYHLTAAEIAEEEALFIEIKRLQQTERRYRSDRDDLMRTVMGLDSGLVELDQDNIEQILGHDKSKKRKRLDDEMPPSPAPPVTKKQKESAVYGKCPNLRRAQVLIGSDTAHGIYRLPPPPINQQTSHLAAKHPPHIPAFLRSSKMPTPRSNTALRVTEMLLEAGVNAQRLVMPTMTNFEAFDGLLHASSALADMRRQVARVEQELRTLRLQREGFVPPPDSRRRSESVTSVETATTNARSRLG